MDDEFIIKVIADRMESEVGWSEASKVFNHYSFIDLVTHLFCEKGLRTALLDAYKAEIEAAREAEAEEMEFSATSAAAYAEWKADAATRGEEVDLGPDRRTQAYWERKM